MNRAGYILLLFLTLVFSSCSKSKDTGENAGKDSISVSMDFDGAYLEESNPDRTQSQFYLRNHSFSYYFRTYFTEGIITLKLLISSGEAFELNKWYNLPTAETEKVWESFAMIIYDRGYHKAEDDKKAVAGRVLFTEFSQTGSLNYSGEGVCSIKGEFEITLENNKPANNTIEIKNGKFDIPTSKYWDSRAMED